MTRIQKFIMTTALLIAVTVAFFTLSPFAFAEGSAESSEGTVQDVYEPPTEEKPEDPDDAPAEPPAEEQTIVEQFIEHLKETYGADYQRYYDFIMAEWGSVEEYLSAMGEDLPEGAKDSWNKFVSWLDTYAVIWVPIVAIALVIIVAVYGKKFLQKLVNEAVDKKVAPINEELNKQSAAQATGLKAVRCLLGKNEKFAATAAELEEQERVLKK